MKKILTIITIIIIYSSSHPNNIRVDNIDAKKYVQILSSNLDSLNAKKFKKEFNRIMILQAIPKGRAVIVKEYSIQYKYLKLGDILDKITNKTKEAKKEFHINTLRL